MGDVIDAEHRVMHRGIMEVDQDRMISLADHIGAIESHDCLSHGSHSLARSTAGNESDHTG